MNRSTIRRGPEWHVTAPARAPRLAGHTHWGNHLRLGWNHDLAVDDLLLVGIELGLDVVDLAAGGAVANATHLQVVDLGAGHELAFGQRLDDVVRRDVDLLEHLSI